ncbi:hypothetical protein [Sphingobium sp. CECT 9361]|uniref:hypothetical protein n=1 Tax=Sphingobium sp. CECT 9361 TaxID=2845384 RepID=UPI001E5D6620|nr:hypothetical protein [Sphingobium sp. CECT 9361]CAH0349487.1 hypothetical protein SPH9361_00631 [Sphingobium sp. CECT 9361]
MTQHKMVSQWSRRKKSLVALALATLGVSGTVWACADSSCYPTWQLAAPSYDCAGRGVLNPGNDTRINLVLLMRSLSPVADAGARPAGDEDNRQFGQTFMSWVGLKQTFWPKATPDPEPSYDPAPACSVSPDVASDFNAALSAEQRLSPAERTALGKIRAQVGCGEVAWDDAAVTSAQGRDYLAYLKAADAFYKEDWAGARQRFASLSRAKSRWVAETATYMPIRIGLRSAIAKAVNEYGDFAGPDKVDPAAVAEARSGIAAYLKAYPKGRYAASAEGLKRRVAWLTGDTAALARAYEKLITTTSGGDEAAAYLAEEIDIKLLEREDATAAIAKAGDTPLLLAIADLKQMRAEESEPAAFAAADLAKQKAQFSRYGDLYGLLQATRAYYAGEEPGAILALLPDAARAKSYTPLAFSRQVMRGMALGRKNDPNEAAFWRDLLSGASAVYQKSLAEMGLAVRWQRDGRLDTVFAQGSPVVDPSIREVLLQTMASPAILRNTARDNARPAHERDVARFTLLFKDLRRGAYGDFGADMALVPADANIDAGLWAFAQQENIPVGLFRSATWSDGFPCPSIAQTAQTLARTPKDHKALLCLGDFYRLNGFDGFGLYTSGEGKDVLGSGPDSFPGKPLLRSDIYSAIIADRSASPDNRAYALYRAVMCYAPSGYNGCSGPFTTSAAMDAAQVPVSQRKAWFTELKTRYPASNWAKTLRFYW